MEQERLHFELEKLKIQSSVKTVSLTSNSSVNEIAPKRVNLKDLVPRFDPKQIDVTLFFMIFERQAEKEKIEKNYWVSQLLTLLPSEMSELILKQPSETADDFEHIKNLIFKRYKLSARALRLKIMVRKSC